MVLDPIRIEVHAFHRSPRPPVVIGAERVIQQKFGPSLRSVDFERDYSRRPDQDAVVALLRDHKGTLLDSKAAAKFGRQLKTEGFHRRMLAQKRKRRVRFTRTRRWAHRCAYGSLAPPRTRRRK